MTAGIYARISLDRHDGEGVARQLADCRALAAERGWDTVEYVDNDLSAWRSKRRPEYERLLEDLAAKRITAVIAYHSDRLYRRLTDLETFTDLVQSVGAEVVTVKAGDIDLSTASGRLIAALLGSVAKHESERIGERVSRSKRERAAQGRPSGGGRRPYGLTADRTALVPDEAETLRAVADAILAGTSWTSQVDALAAAGTTSSAGRPWTVGTLRRTLTSPYVAGLRAYHGEIVGPATWPAIIDRGTWELLRATTDGRGRGRPPSDRHLLTGLLACSRCDRTLWANQTRTGAMAYRCSPGQTTTGRGCGRISISARPLEAHVVDTVAGWLAEPEFLAELDAWLTYGDVDVAEVRSQMDELDRRQVALAERWADGRLGDGEYDAARAVLARRRAELDARVEGAPRRPVEVSGAVLADAWRHGLTVPERREAIGIVAGVPIVVGPGVDEGGVRVPIARRVAGLRPVWEP